MSGTTRDPRIEPRKGDRLSDAGGTYEIVEIEDGEIYAEWDSGDCLSWEKHRHNEMCGRDEVVFVALDVPNPSTPILHVGPAPTYATPGSAGADLRAAENVTIRPGRRALEATGTSIALPDGFEAQVRPRSGMAWKNGVTVLNAPGTIDSDYRGEIKVMLINLGDEPFTVKPGDRIAQLVVARYERMKWTLVETLDDTERGAGGFGSTGRT